MKARHRFFKKVTAVLLVVLMIMSSGIVSVFTFAADTSATVSDATDATDVRYDLKFNSNWKFYLGDVKSAQYKTYSDAAWESVDLPHDFSIEQDFTVTDTENESGNLPGGTGWYRKMFTVPESEKGKSIIINFDGAYSDTYVYVNNQYVGENHYGYNSFSFDITDYITCDGSTQNLIAVKVINDIPTSRWYSGSGINRDVTLTICDNLHISEYGTKVETVQSGSNENATVTGETNTTVTLQNDTNSSKSVTVGAVILDSNGNEVSSEETTDATVSANASTSVTLSPSVSSPKLWSVDTPTLYTMRVNVYENDELIDRYDTDFGYRSIYWDASNGFYLNGTSMKIKGVCLHSDSGALGSIQTYDAIYRQMSILKDMGVNAVRTSHNIASQVFIDVCNDIGMMVMEEFFDGWDSEKNGNTNDFSKYFSTQISSSNNILGKTDSETWAEFALTQAVKRDRNAPSIIIWDAGNELLNASSSANYATIAANIDSWVSALDTSRPLTEGNNKGTVNSALSTVDSYMDVIGGNYYPSSWVNGRDTTKAFVATETASAVSTRGYYANSYSDVVSNVRYSKNNQINAYDASYVSWGNSAADAWYYAAVNDWFSGEFVWTGFDYIGEPTPWWSSSSNGSTVPNSSYFGIIDTAGFEKDSYYLYRSMWNTDSYTTHLVPGTWNQDSLGNASTVPVSVYSNAARIELYLNNTLIGRATSKDNTTSNGYTYKTWTETAVDTSVCSATSALTGANDHDLYAQFSVTYAAGTLMVKAYDSNDNEITSQCAGTKMVTSGTSVAGISSDVWTLSPQSDGSSYAYVEFTAVDANGNFVNDYNGSISVSLNGTGSDSAVFAGADNGNAATTEKYQYNVLSDDGKTASIDMFNGKALAIVKVLNTDEKGTVSISQVAGTGDTTLSGASFTFTADTTADEYEEVFNQSSNTYESTFYDTYNMLNEEFNLIDGTNLLNNKEYVLYSASNSTSSASYLEDGYYGFTGAATNNYAKGVLLSTTYGSTGIKSSGSYTFSTSSTAWHLERQSDGTYYMSANVNGTTKYINIGTSSSSLTLSTTPQKLKINLNASAGTCTISNSAGSQYINYFGQGTNQVNTWSDGTALTIYSATGTTGNYTFTKWTPPTTQGNPNGKYVIYNQDYVISNTAASTTALAKSSCTVTDDTIETAESNVFTFTWDSGDKYFITDVNGNYLTIGSSASLTLSTTATSLTVYARSDGTVLIYNGAQFIDYYSSNGKVFSTWSSSTSTTNANEILTLYKETNSTDAGSKSDLYTALTNAIAKKPGVYKMDGYGPLLDAIADGIDILNSDSSTESDYTTAAQTINDAIEALQRNVTKFNSALYKYGFNSTQSGSARYPSDGAHDYTVQTIAQMKNAILASSDLVSQIKEIIGSTEQEDIELAAEYYAKIYTLDFKGYGVCSGSTIDSLSYHTAWNWWDKTNSNLSTDSQNEGASILGLYSTSLYNGVPTSHSVYSDALPYVNTHSGTTNNVSVTIGGNSVTLTPLKNISVYAPDFFSENNVTSGITDTLSTVTTTTSSEYSKYYWNTRFPFITETDEYGINNYSYNSNDDTYIYRAYFDDENQTAYSTLQDVDGWDITRQNKGSGGKGLFPFNYQLSSRDDTSGTTFTGENAIYHYGMSVNTTFALPNTKDRKYNNGGDGEDVVFNFSGDDDVLVYIDGTLVLDNGGLHGARSFSINFTEQSVTYQYAFDTASGTIITPSENITYTYGDDANNAANGITEDIQLALNKLHSIYEAGAKQEHELDFYYMERGSTDSNCLITFNLQPTDGYVELDDQELVADYGHDISYDAMENNVIYEEAVESGSYYEYLGIIKAGNESNLPKMSFTYDESKIDYLFSDNNDSITIDGNFGTFTATHTYELNSDGNKSSTSCKTEYKQKNMQFTDEDTFYLVAKVTKDPIFTNEVYYTYEKVVYVPATSIYYEDDYKEGTANGITYTNGAENSWQTVNSGSNISQQDADLVGDSGANVYGFDSHYSSFAKYSNNTAHKVTVTDNDSTSWPSAQFKFSGTGFDVISLTSNKSGVFVVSVYNDLGKRVKYKIVDTYYGYSYGQIYRDADGNPTLSEYVLDENGEATDVKNTPMYIADRNLEVKDDDGNTLLDENGSPVMEANGQNMSETVRYYDTKGDITTTPKYWSYVDSEDVMTDTVMYYSTDSAEKYTETPTYYDENGDLTTEVTDKPAYALAYEYAYAYGWLNDAAGAKDALYQIPVMKIENLTYGTYDVKIEARYADVFDHTTDEGSYDLYLDAIRIYEPAGIADSTSANNRNSVISDAYVADNEAFAYYSEIKDMIIGSETIDSGTTTGVLFIDGKGAVGSDDLDAYKTAGPNNELYLDAGQSVAFEILATSVPKDVQISSKVAKSGENSNPILSLTYGNQATTNIDVTTATDMYYSIADNINLTWTLTTVDGKQYYTSGVIIIGNGAAENSGNILSVTNIKWTFDLYGAQGYYRIPTTLDDESVQMVVTGSTVDNAVKLINMTYADLEIKQDNVSVKSSKVELGSPASINITTSTDVASLLIKDKNGNVVTPKSIACETVTYGNTQYKVWTVMLSENSTGVYTYTVKGVYENGYTDDSAPANVTIYVINTDTGSDDTQISFTELIVRIFKIIVNGFLKYFGVQI